MNYLWEGLNPVYLLPAILLVCYLNLLGKAVNSTFKTSIPNTLSGLSFSLITSAPFILPAHWGLVSYSKTLYLIPLMSSFMFIICFYIKKPSLFKINKKLLLIATIVYLASIVQYWRTLGVAHDYWLYGKWISAGSKFEYAVGDHMTGYTYGLTIMYTWLGSFSGLFNGATSQVPLWTLHLQWQILGSLLFVFITVEIMMKLVDGFNLKVIAWSSFVAAILIGSTPLFSLSFYGSFSMFWIMLSLLSVKDNYGKNTILITLGFLFMVSSTLVASPLIIATFILLKYKKIKLNKKILNFSHVINPIIIVIVWLLSYDWHVEFELFYFIRRIMVNYLVIVSAFIIMKFTTDRIKNIIVINSFLVLIASLILNVNWNLTGIDSMPGNIMHRYLGFILGHARASVIVSIITFPWAMHLLYEHYKTKKDLK